MVSTNLARELAHARLRILRALLQVGGWLTDVGIARSGNWGNNNTRLQHEVVFDMNPDAGFGGITLCITSS